MREDRIMQLGKRIFHTSTIIRIIVIILVIISLLSIKTKIPSSEGYPTNLEYITSYSEEEGTLNPENAIIIDRFVPNQREIDLIFIGHGFSGVLEWDEPVSLNNTEGLLLVSLTNVPKDITETEEKYRERTWKPTHYPFDYYFISIRFTLNTSFEHDFDSFNYKVLSRTNNWHIRAGISKEYFWENFPSGNQTHTAYSVIIKLAHPYNWGLELFTFLKIIEIAIVIIILFAPYKDLRDISKWMLGISIVLLVPGTWLSPEIGTITKLFNVVKELNIVLIISLVLFSIFTEKRVEKIDKYVKNILVRIWRDLY